MKSCVRRIDKRAWSAPTSSDSVELFMAILSLLEKLIVALLPSDMMAPMCPRSWVVWEALTHHRIVVRLFVDRLSFMCRMPLR